VAIFVCLLAILLVVSVASRKHGPRTRTNYGGGRPRSYGSGGGGGQVGNGSAHAAHHGHNSHHGHQSHHDHDSHHSPDGHVDHSDVCSPGDDSSGVGH
jgi:hypothetical protein